ncbi:MAG TPA: hypothetical protein VNC50_14285, partial [Planctomycetia bacterium]|nr:hypothetical protein [Planctomycetia bacterium]
VRRAPFQTIAARIQSLCAGLRARRASEPGDLDVASTVAGLLHNLGTVENEAGLKEQALKRFELAVKHQLPAFAAAPEKRRSWLSNHFEMTARMLRELGRPADAVPATRERAKLWPKNGDALLECAAEHAACIASAKGESAATIETWSAEATGWIAAALAAGAKPETIAKDGRFASLQGRADFKKLLASPATPKPAPANR